MLPQLDSTYYSSQLFWLFICFIILIVLFKKVFVPRMNSLLNKRDSIITEGKLSIDKLKTEIADLEDEIESIKRREIKQTSQIIKNAIAKTEKTLDEQLNFIKNENAEIIHAERLKFRSEVDSLSSVYKSQIDNFSNDLLQKLFWEKSND